MAREKRKEKPYKRNDELTHQQEIFCQEVAKGETQTDAYLTAYPTSETWQREAVWVQASILAGKEKIQRRIRQIKEDYQEEEKWTRKRVLSNIEYAISNSKSNLESRKRIYDEMLEDKYNDLMQWSNLKGISNIDVKTINSQIRKITKEIRDIELKKNSLELNNNGIVSLLTLASKIKGFDISPLLEDESANKVEELRKELSIEELRQLAYKKEEK